VFSAWCTSISGITKKTLFNLVPPSSLVPSFGSKKSLTVQNIDVCWVLVQFLCTTAYTAVLQPFRRLAGVNCSLVFCRYINEDKITIYVEHPVPLDPPVTEAPAPPQPHLHTAKEKKKIRKQRREEREKERQVCMCSWDGPDCSLLVGRSSVTLHDRRMPLLFVCKGCPPWTIE